MKLEDTIRLALLDTGASRSFVRTACGSRPQLPSRVQIRIADGSYRVVHLSRLGSHDKRAQDSTCVPGSGPASRRNGVRDGLHDTLRSLPSSPRRPRSSWRDIKNHDPLSKSPSDGVHPSQPAGYVHPRTLPAIGGSHVRRRSWRHLPGGRRRRSREGSPDMRGKVVPSRRPHAYLGHEYRREATSSHTRRHFGHVCPRNTGGGTRRTRQRSSTLRARRFVVQEPAHAATSTVAWLWLAALCESGASIREDNCRRAPHRNGGWGKAFHSTAASLGSRA